MSNQAEPEPPDPPGPPGRRQQAPNAQARLQAALRELSALARDQAATELEATVARLKARRHTPGADAASEAAPARTPRWLWSDRPRADKLHRIPRGTGEAKLFGVCAGFAHFYGIETLVLRLALVALFFVTNGLPLLVYLVAALMMDTEPAAATEARRAKQRRRDRRSQRCKRRAPGRPAPPPPKLAAVRRGYGDLEARLQGLERFVTSKRYQLQRELAAVEAADNERSRSG